VYTKGVNVEAEKLFATFIVLSLLVSSIVITCYVMSNQEREKSFYVGDTYVGILFKKLKN